MRAKLTGAWTQRSSPVAGIDGSSLDRLLQDVVKETLCRVARSPLRPERRPLLRFSQGGKKRAIQLSRARSFHLGFENELGACFPDGAPSRTVAQGRAGSSGRPSG